MDQDETNEHPLYHYLHHYHQLWWSHFQTCSSNTFTLMSKRSERERERERLDDEDDKMRE